jgi:2'-5' RNA ligase
MRLFCAISPPEPVLAALEALQDEIPAGRLTPPENLHLTLAFLGEVAQGDAEAVHDEFLRIDAPRFRVELQGLGTFGSREPQILFAGVAQNAALDALHRKIRGALHAAGLMTGRERFRPHITLARFGARLAPDEETRLADFLAAKGAVRPGGFAADYFSLFRSTLGKGPTIHEELARYPLL